MFEGIITVQFKNIFLAVVMAITSLIPAFAESASVNFSVVIPEYLKIVTVTSPVLTAHITDRTGNLYAPLSTKFKVISNSGEQKILYLKSESVTDSGSEPSMFNMGGQVYIAFTNVNNKPRSSALANCKMGSHPKYTAGVVAYPVISVTGAKTSYQRGEGKYKVFINNGTTDINVNIGSHVLKSSFGANDPKGFYQATLLLTESDI